MNEKANVGFVRLKNDGPNESGKYPVAISVYYKVTRNFRTGIFLNDEEWEKIQAKAIKDPRLKETRMRIEAKVNKAKGVIDQLSDFSFPEFVRHYKGIAEAEEREKQAAEKKRQQEEAELIRKEVDRKANYLFSTLTQEYIDELNKNGQVGTAGGYISTKNGVEAFRPGLKISELDLLFLEGFEKYHQEQGNANATIGMYMRNVRRICNIAKKKGLMSADAYPFPGYTIPTGSNVKKALPAPSIKKVLDFKPKTADYKIAYSYWIFSYLCNGMNMADIAQLKKSDILGEYFSFFRQKTIRTRKKNKVPVKVHIHPIARDVMQYFINHVTAPASPFVFPILSEGLEPKTIKNRTKKVIKFVNATMTEIGTELGIGIGPKSNITTYAARHSFATLLKRKGVPYEEISEYLGHNDLNVTKAYLDTFEDETLKERSQLLTAV